MKRSAGSSRAMDVDVTCHELPDGSDPFYLLRCRLLSGVSLAVVVTALAASDAGLSPALALDECGALVGGSATCTPAGNPYATGISYNTANTAINLTLLPGVQVTTNATVANAVSAFSTFGPSPVDAPVTLSANDAAITLPQARL